MTILNKANTSKRLLEIMNERHLKQKDILDLTEPYCKEYGIKLSKTDLSQYVSGKTEPGQHKLMILSFALNLNPVWLMGYDVSKELYSVTIRDHEELDDSILYAIDILVRENGYSLKKFANAYQLEYNDTIIKLSPNQIDDYKNEILKQVDFVTKGIYTSRLRSSIHPLREEHIPEPEYLTVDAAHERTDIVVTDEMRKHDDDIMDDENF